MFLFCRFAKIGHDDVDGRSGSDDEYITTSDNNCRDWCCRGFFARRRTIADLRDEKTATYYTVDATWRREGRVRQWPVICGEGRRKERRKENLEGRMSDR
eukprot:scaffold4880_cov173-Skeletonema_dohrnii-CCMP3373.AAC.8